MRRPEFRRALLWRGQRTVLVTYPGLRLGNYLYFAMHARRAALEGLEYRVLDTGLGDEWYTHFHGLRSLLTKRAGIRDRRAYIPPLFFQHYGVDFDEPDLREFVGGVLRVVPQTASDGGTVTLNVRRGDYYASDSRRWNLGFDVADYLDTALRLSEADGPITGVKIVSDDGDWALKTVQAVRPTLAVDEVVAGPPLNHFLALAHSTRLILANSTFSYWGAYTSAALYGRESLSVYAPDLHDRGILDGKPWQHAPWWRKVPIRLASERETILDAVEPKYATEIRRYPYY